MALNAITAGSSIALGYGIAHECEWPDNLPDKVMDLYNNSKGIEIGLANPGLSESELATLICNYLSSGDMKMINLQTMAFHHYNPKNKGLKINN